MSVFNYQKDQQGIVTITMDMTGPVNAMNAEYKVAMHEAVNRLEQEQGLVGVILASAKRVFFAGADLKDLVRATPDHAEEIYRDIQLMKHDMRRLEKLPLGLGVLTFSYSGSCNHLRRRYDHPIGSQSL